MIWQPKAGQFVTLHYGRRAREAGLAPYEGERGKVLRVGRGPGPINVQVLLLGLSKFVTVPRGNLVAEGRRPDAA